MAETPREAGFGRRLRDRRMERHLNQLKLAERMKVPQTYISRWESGHFEYMTLERLRALKRILQISLDELIGRDSEPVGEETDTESGHEPTAAASVGA